MSNGSFNLMMMKTGIVLMIISIASAWYDPAYMRRADDGYTLKRDWMSKIRDDVKLREMALPGTESSGAFDFGKRGPIIIPTKIMDVIKQIALIIMSDATTMHALGFDEQLAFGIRVLELELWPISSKLILVSGYTALNMDLSQALDAVQSFLTKHPTETVLINLLESKRYKPFGATCTFEEALDSYFAGASKWLNTSDADITLKQARGKFILISREIKFQHHALIMNTINSNIMDTTHLNTNWNLYWDKWIPVKGFLTKTAHSSEEKFFVNYINGWGGSFPYFIVSGKSSPQTWAPLLLTGLTTLESSGQYPDFPRVDCISSFCLIAFQGTNILVRDQILKYNQGFKHERTVGIIMTDFPGEDLILNIVKNNYPLVKQEDDFISTNEIATDISEANPWKKLTGKVVKMEVQENVIS